MEFDLDEEKAKLFMGRIEGDVFPGEVLRVHRGYFAAFGSDPEASVDSFYCPHARIATFRGNEKGIELSQLALYVGIRPDGKVWMMRTGSNLIVLNELAEWNERAVVQSNEIKLQDSHARLIDPRTAIDIKTSDGSVIRLKPLPEGPEVTDETRVSLIYQIQLNLEEQLTTVWIG